MAGVLDGIRVLDFGRYIAGPYAAGLLAQFGAEVIRVEKIAGGEDRYVYPYFRKEDGSEGEGAIFLQTSVNKLSVTLNPMKPEGREIVQKLVKTADVVLANLPHQAMMDIGIDYDTLVKIKPDIIVTEVSTFGATGPYAHRPGFDGIGQVMSGAAWFTGEPGHPVKANAPYVDFGTALSATMGTLAAIIHKMKTGEGQLVEAALLKTGLTFFSSMLSEQDLLQLNRQPSGNLVQTSAPSDIFATKDGHILVHTVGNGLFARWARMLGEEDQWVNDPRFGSDDLRGQNNKIICDRMADWCAQRTTEQAMADMDAAGVPCGPVYTPQQALDDPQVQHMQHLVPVDLPGAPRPPLAVKAPATLSKSPAEITRHPPLLGEHTEQILGELGYSTADIKALRDKRVV